MSWEEDYYKDREESRRDEEIEMSNIQNSDSEFISPKKSKFQCLNFMKKTWAKFTETKEVDPDDLNSLDMYYLNSELEDLETPPRYRPDSLESLCKATRFSEAEIKRIYRGFKAECPTGIVREDTFKMIYAQFFPQGVNSSQYAHYVFNTLDQDHSGLISFEDFVQNLSILSRGSLEEKLRWAFTLYDINGDGCITREEMTDIVTAIYELMGKLADPSIEEDTIKEKVDRIFQKMDKNRDGVVTLDEFLECCQKDESISSSMNVFDTSI
ncbi:A-type potassium channel modulatory protein KCNIP1 isoform X2 [Leptinotarsa decemlineata]|uniref:A-type potassium channel modulatory protein KCNIP1 isoform X2 n=1 Tax=Leptinotarsa decemlineata TaxID=7539 RepID=UPI003D3067A4